MKPRPAFNGLSIGYRVRDSELHRTGPIKRTLKQIDLVECSLVTFPADKFARVASVKSWLEDEPEPPAMTFSGSRLVAIHRVATAYRESSAIADIGKNAGIPYCFKG